MDFRFLFMSKLRVCLCSRSADLTALRTRVAFRYTKASEGRHCSIASSCLRFVNIINAVCAIFLFCPRVAIASRLGDIESRKCIAFEFNVHERASATSRRTFT